ncbi:alpha/beta hydrolase [Brevundimonas staleyi]|uniref:Alpha/beta hydrolase n=1 Tax=Brevundimonas staleyi TaxID=74326 RepID=A0ABW0FVA0_9CAUL
MSLSPQSWSPFVLPRATTRLVTAAANGHAYRLSLSVPKGAPPEAGFPMLLVLDGGALFPTVAETERRLSHRSEVTGVEPMVIVGVGPGHTEMYDTAQRHRDFTPGPPLLAEDAGRFETGGAEAFLAFLLDEAIPLAAGQVRVDPARISLMGHSLAGYFALDVLTRRPDAFAAYAAVSPSIWWNPERLLEGVAGLQETPAGVLLAVGRREQNDAPADERRNRRRMVDAVEDLGARLSARLPGRIRVEVFPDEDHASVVSVAAVRALRLATAT